MTNGEWLRGIAERRGVRLRTLDEVKAAAGVKGGAAARLSAD